MNDANPLNYELPTPVDLPRADISAIAENVRKKVGYNPGDPLEPIVVKLGGEIRYVETHDNSGSIIVEPGRFWISISKDTSLARDRFTVAHELGHYVLHYLYQNQRNRKNIVHLQAQRNGSDQAEFEANWFAAAFLMPAILFREKYQHTEKNLFAVAQHFDVSPQAAQVRAESLNLR